MFKYALDSQALKDLKKLSPEIQKRILSKLEFFISSPNPLVFADHLVNRETGEYRFRIGDYRVIFDVEDESLIILTLGHRREIYK